MPITLLRQRMSDAMQLRGFAPKTMQSYLYAVERLSRHYDYSPDKISPDQIQAWFLYLVARWG